MKKKERGPHIHRKEDLLVHGKNKIKFIDWDEKMLRRFISERQRSSGAAFRHERPLSLTHAHTEAICAPIRISHFAVRADNLR